MPPVYKLPRGTRRTDNGDPVERRVYPIERKRTTWAIWLNAAASFAALIGLAGILVAAGRVLETVDRIDEGLTEHLDEYCYKNMVDWFVTRREYEMPIQSHPGDSGVLPYLPPSNAP